MRNCVSTWVLKSEIFARPDLPSRLVLVKDIIERWANKPSPTPKLGLLALIYYNRGISR